MQRTLVAIISAIGLLASAAAPVRAQSGEAPAITESTAVQEPSGPLPRMASIRSELVNARSGPGSRYPIEWVYRQKGAPVEIVAEFELWRKIRDWEGSESWVHKAMLSSQRTVKVVAAGENSLYARPDAGSRIVAKVEDQVVGSVSKCPSGLAFCQARFKRYEGWLPRAALFGVYEKESID